MKIFTLSILLSSLICFSQTNKSSVEVELSYCKSKNQTDLKSLINPSFLFSQDSGHVFQINKGYFKNDSIEPGNYTFHIYNIFTEKIEKKVQLEANKEYKYKFCIDSIQTDTIKTFLDSLDADFELLIKYYSTECFIPPSFEKLSIISKCNEISATLIINDNKEYEVTNVSKKILDNLITFEKELRLIVHFSDSSVDFFDIKLRNNEIVLMCNTYRWEGYENLKREIFKIE